MLFLCCNSFSDTPFSFSRKFVLDALMSFTNTPERYGVISAALHWISAIIVYGMFALGLWMVTLSYYDGWYHKAPELHKSIGILLMMGLVIRVLWRVISPPPGPLQSYSSMTRLGAKAGHLALYLLLFAIGISAAETAVAIAIIINIYRNLRHIQVKDLKKLKW